ncbi:MAG: DUF6062 family protein [Clostridia bacterium]|nr:DUF6062 family protein [Clostridia bacterium]
MEYHIDTGLIKQKMNSKADCPLCEIRKIVEEQFIHEFLNDAVMEETTRLKVNRLGFCKDHFKKLFSGQNKLSVALQLSTRSEEIKKQLLNPIKNVSNAKTIAKKIDESSKTCIICDLVEESMIKYYKTIAQMFLKEEDFFNTLMNTKGFCLNHYARLLEYSSFAGFLSKEYVKVLSELELKSFNKNLEDLNAFCTKHDYRNANKPLLNAESALKNMGIKLYGKD